MGAAVGVGVTLLTTAIATYVNSPAARTRDQVIAAAIQALLGIALLVWAAIIFLAGRVHSKSFIRSETLFTGVWLSEYSYPGAPIEKAADNYAQHYVVLRHRGRTVRGRSLEQTAGSILTLELTVHSANILTGTWIERTSPRRKFRGKTYHGGIQLVANGPRDYLVGKWVGFGSDPGEVNAGDWRLTREEHDIKRTTRKSYVLKL